MTVRHGHVFYEALAVPLEPLTLRLIAYRIAPGSPEALLLGLTLRYIARHGLRIGGTKTVGRGLLAAPASEPLTLSLACTGDASQLPARDAEETTPLEKTLTMTPEELLEALAGEHGKLPQSCYQAQHTLHTRRGA
jgi:hypothetical protein